MTAASGGNREELLGQRPAGCERKRSRRWEPQPVLAKRLAFLGFDLIFGIVKGEEPLNSLRGEWSPEVGRGESKHPSLPLARAERKAI